MGTLCEDLCTFMIISPSITFFWKSCRLRNNMEIHGRTREATDNNIIWCMHFVCWTTKATHIYSEYLIPIVCPWQQRFHKCASKLHLYVHCLACYKTARYLSEEDKMYSNVIYIYMYTPILSTALLLEVTAIWKRLWLTDLAYRGTESPCLMRALWPCKSQCRVK